MRGAERVFSRHLEEQKRCQRGCRPCGESRVASTDIGQPACVESWVFAPSTRAKLHIQTMPSTLAHQPSSERAI